MVSVAASSGERWFNPARPEISSEFQMAHDQRDDEKRRHHCEHIAGEIIHQRRLPARAQRRHAQQQIAGVGDAGITEQTFQIALRQRAEIAVKNRDAGNDDEQVRPMRGHARHGGEQHAQQQHKSGGLGTDGEKRGRRRRRALINVRRPNLKRKRGDLETESNQNQQHAEQKDLAGFKLRRDGGEFGEIQFAGRAPDQRDAEHHECRRQRAENQVFHAGFERLRVCCAEN